MSKLNNDILYYMFQELNEVDENSLFTCLLVNKLWCKLIIPILWRCPMKHWFYKIKRKKLLFKTIILHLSENSRKLLKNNHINIKKQKLSFNYISYCKYIGMYKIFPYVFNSKSRLNDSQIMLLRQEIYKLFISECSNIKYLDSPELCFPLYQFPGANLCLTSLCELDCRTDHDPSILEGLAQICRSIEKIHIILAGGINHGLMCNYGLIKLIEMQKQIKYIKLMDYLNTTECRCESFSQALEKQAHSILYLNLQMMSFSHFIFSSFINLEALILFNKYEKLDDEKHPVVTTYPKLQILELHQIPLNMATKIIQNTDGNLWKIKIRTSNFYYSREYIQSIHKYCPYVKYASVFINNQNLDELENLLINCQHLEAIDIIKMDGYFDIVKFLNLLIKFAPTILYKIHISLKIFTINSLNLLAENWKGRKTLHLYDHDSNWFEEIEKYKFEGVVGHNNCVDFWNVDNYSAIQWNC
ncbi:hypothetical protein C1645_818500 [Glomus cerebriforme]|uniref:F-box domain-containing protein n=1 Tax=Glomus cerebriforme TaxID=658196 RepID=A0A397T787_9GLOM|nr:hypothetical protein C1645_818500 [Glomus cerebriforme]